MALSETVQVVLAIPVLIIVGLSFLARKHPDVRWLQPFNLQAHLTEEQRARLRRSQNRTVGAELILLGVIILLGYLALKVMLVSTIERGELALVALLSLTCVVFGVAALVRNR